MVEYRLSPRAQRDLGEIFDYTVERWGLPQALRYTDLIATACADLADAPERGYDCGDIRPGHRAAVSNSM